MFFRGPLAAAARRRWSPRLLTLLVLAQAAVFGRGHHQYGPYNEVTAGLAGVLLGAAAVRSRSLWPTVIGHGLYNTYSFLRIVHGGS